MADANIFLIATDDEGQAWRFINFNEPALGNPGFTTVVRLDFYDLQNGDSGQMGTITGLQFRIQNPNFSEITGYRILIQNPVATAKEGTLYFDNLQIKEPD